jgi:hypothetical protein
MATLACTESVVCIEVQAPCAPRHNAVARIVTSTVRVAAWTTCLARHKIFVDRLSHGILLRRSK